MKHGVLKHPGRWIWLPVIILAAIGLARVHFDAEIFDLLPSDLPVSQGLKLYQRHFANARDLIVTLHGTNSEDVEAAARGISDRLRPLTNLVASVTWEAPWMEHPEQSAELLAYLWFNQPPAVFHSLLDRLAPAPMAEVFAAARDRLATALSPEDIARLSYDPLDLTTLPGAAAGAAPAFGRGERLFSSPDGQFRIVYVRAKSELRDYRECDEWLNEIQPVVSAGLPAGIELGYTGRPAFVTEIAGGMKHDILFSVGGTAAVIAVLFWLAHRRVKPMLWLLTLLALDLAGTMALGGLIYGTINVVSIGFAAILLGLAVDYAVVHYQEALAQPELSIPEIRRAIAPSIFWAAVTTISAFLVLNLGGLPGLGQLGTMVGLGVALAATVMIFEYLPPLFPDRREPGPEAASSPPPPAPVRAPPRRAPAIFGLTAVLALFGLAVLAVEGLPRVDTTANALRPRHSAAYDAFDQIEKQLAQAHQPLWVIVDGATVAEVADRLARLQPILDRAISNQVLNSVTMPTPIWPRPDYQEANRVTARELGGRGDVLQTAGKAGGFGPTSLGLANAMIDIWRKAGVATNVFWPENPLSRWILDKAVARAPNHFYALGLLNARDNAAGLDALTAEVSALGGVHLSGWEMLGRAIFLRVHGNLWKVVSPMILLVMLSLWLAFRRWREIALGLAVLGLSGVCLLAVMRLAGWSWNLLDLMAVPLILGTGVDYGLFSLLALRRHDGDLAMAYRSVGRALLLCGGTAVAAFASLAFSTSAGMASLGQLCAVGIAANVLIAVFLLPIWWSQVRKD